MWATEISGLLVTAAVHRLCRPTRPLMPHLPLRCLVHPSLCAEILAKETHPWGLLFFVQWILGCIRLLSHWLRASGCSCEEGTSGPGLPIPVLLKPSARLCTGRGCSDAHAQGDGSRRCASWTCGSEAAAFLSSEEADRPEL